MPDPQEGYDDQDGAEAFDETNLDDDKDLGEMRTFEELPDHRLGRSGRRRGARCRRR